MHTRQSLVNRVGLLGCSGVLQPCLVKRAGHVVLGCPMSVELGWHHDGWDVPQNVLCCAGVGTAPCSALLCGTTKKVSSLTKHHSPNNMHEACATRLAHKLMEPFQGHGGVEKHQFGWGARALLSTAEQSNTVFRGSTAEQTSAVGTGCSSLQLWCPAVLSAGSTRCRHSKVFSCPAASVP